MKDLILFAGAIVIFYLLKVIFDSMTANKLILWADGYLHSLLILAAAFLILYLVDRIRKRATGK